MPPTSDEELQQLQESVEDLRAQVVDANAEKEAYERSLANDTYAAQLKAEQARLEAELATIKNVRDSSEAGGGASVPLDQATAQMEAALQSRDAAEEAGVAAAEAREAADDDATADATTAATATGVGTTPSTTASGTTTGATTPPGSPPNTVATATSTTPASTSTGTGA